MKTLRFATGLLFLLTSGVAAAEEFNWRDHVSVWANDRMRGEFVQWFAPGGPKSNNAYNFFANRARLGVSLSFPSVEFVVEGQDTAMVNLPGANAIANGAGTPNVGPLGPGAIYFANTRDRDQTEVTLHRGFATVREFGLPGVSARVGRMGYNLGQERIAKDAAVAWLQRARISQRLIGEFEYTNVGRSFDAVQALYDHGPANVTLMASHPTAGGFNINANKTIDDIDLVSGVASLIEAQNFAPQVLQLFYVYYQDRRDLVATDNRAQNPPAGSTCATVTDPSLYSSCDRDTITINTLGGNVVQMIDAGPGRVDLLGWVAGQFGDWNDLNHTGWAYATEVGYQLPNETAKPWVRLGFFRSSGDSDPNDHDHDTFFQIIPTARVYALFPFYNLMNNQDLFVQALLKPLPGVGVNVSGHWLRNVESADRWYSGGGATSSSNFGYNGINAKGHSELAYLADLELSYAYDKHLSFYAYYGHAFGQGIVNANFAQGDDADYAYVETTVAF